MAIDDVLKKVAAEQAAKEQSEQARKAAAAEAAARDKRIKEEYADSEEKKAAARRLIKERKKLEGIVKELASGQYEEGSRGYMTLLGEATKLDNSIKATEKKLGVASRTDGEGSKGTTKAAAVEKPFGGTTTGLTSTSKGGVTVSTEAKEPVTKDTTPAATKKPADTKAKVTTGGFNAGSFRMADEASMAGLGEITATTATTAANVGNKDLETLLGSVEQYFDLPDYIFRMDKDLGDLLVRAVNEGWNADRWKKELKLTNWWRKNSDEVRKRLTTYGNYEDLRASGQDVSKSDYALWISKKKNALKADARAIAGVALTDAQADEIAKKIYLGFLDDDENAIRAFLVPFIGKTTSIVGGQSVTGYGGQALQNLQVLQGIAKANGLTLKDILPGISTTTTGGDLEEAVLEKLALGELDINRISQDARALAAIGQPEYVKGLLNQGYDLEQVYAPYKTRMAAILELNPDQIDLNDSALRAAITDKGESNLYDFEKALRRDARWQYTQNARQEVSNSVLGVLRDFGFQG